MENKYPAKKDLTKTEMFIEFLMTYPAEMCSVEVLKTSFETPVQTQTTTSPVAHPAEMCSVEVLETSFQNPVQNPVQTQTTTSPVAHPAEMCSVEVLETSFQNPVQNPVQTQTTTSSAYPVQTQTTTSSAYPVQTQTTTSSAYPVQTQTTTSLISDIIDELFGPGGLDQYVDHMENADEGIEINTIDELKLDLEDFDFELETVDF